MLALNLDDECCVPVDKVGSGCGGFSDLSEVKSVKRYAGEPFSTCVRQLSLLTTFWDSSIAAISIFKII